MMRASLNKKPPKASAVADGLDRRRKGIITMTASLPNDTISHEEKSAPCNAIKIVLAKGASTRPIKKDLKALGGHQFETYFYSVPIANETPLKALLASKKIKASLHDHFDPYFSMTQNQKLVADERQIVDSKENQLQFGVRDLILETAALEKEVKVRELQQDDQGVTEFRKKLEEKKAQLKSLQEEIEQRRNKATLFDEMESSDPLPAGFKFDKAGNLVYQKEGDGEEDPLPIFICSRLEIVACTRDENNQNHGKLLKFSDVDGHIHDWPMPMRLLAGSGIEYREFLMDSGLNIASSTKARNLLSRYLQACKPEARVRCVSKLGWHEELFVFPKEIIGSHQKEEIRLQSDSPILPDFHTKGSLEDWRSHLALKAMGNSRLLFSISIAFGPPLLHWCEIENGGFHWRGKSSRGKSTGSFVGNSVWGPPSLVQSWRSTANAIEATASTFNDGLLVLDEISLSDPATVGTTAYSLSNGMGKGRAECRGYLRKRSFWRLLFLSNGEVSLPSHMLEAGRKSRAGQEVRILDIPSETGVHGFFENLHGMESGKEFADLLKNSCSAYYGTAIREFLRRFQEKRSESVLFIKERIQRFVQKFVVANADGQIFRAATRFGLVAAAGELASSFGITGWPEGAATDAATVCFKVWLDARGGSGSKEELDIVAQVKRFFALHGSSRFSNWGEQGDKTVNRCGFKKIEMEETEFFVFPATFKSDISSGFDPSHVAEVCIREGLIKPYSQRDKTHPIRIPGMKSTIRCYLFTERVLEDER